MGVMTRARGLGLGVLIWILAVPIFLFTRKSSILSFKQHSISRNLPVFPLVSSTSMSTNGIYLLTYSWNSDDNSWLRLGYYGEIKHKLDAWPLLRFQGLCIVGHNKKSGFKDHCQSTSGKSSKDLAKHWSIDDTSAFDYPLRLQHDVFVAFLTAGGIIWLVSLIMISLVILRGSSAGRIVRSISKITALCSAVLMMASAWATNAAVRALEATADGKEFKGGLLLYGLQWVGAILCFIYTYLVNSVADSEDGKTYYLGRGV